MSNNQKNDTPFDGVSKKQTDPYKDDKLALQAFKALMNSADETAFREYIRELANLLPDQKAGGFITGVAALDEAQWQDIYISSQDLILDVSDNSTYFFGKNESIEESTEFGELPGIRYYDIITLDEDNSQEGFTVVFAGSGEQTKFIPFLVFFQLLQEKE